MLGSAVAALERVDPMVAALPRGGVPVGFEVAARLGCQLDVLVIRKVGVPFHPELAMGAVGEGGVVIRNEEVLGAVRLEPDVFPIVAETERVELERRLARYRQTVPGVDPAGRTAVIVDDGLATGSTALAAVAVLRERGAGAVWLAVPVAPIESVRLLETVTDHVVVLETPRSFVAVGSWYRDFDQTSDEEVIRLLEESRRSGGH